MPIRRPSGSPSRWRARHAVEVELLARKLEALLIVAAVVVLARNIVVRHGGGRHEVLVAHVPRVAPDLARDRVHHQLHGEADAGARDAAIGEKAGLVGRDAVGAAAIAAEIVRTRQVADRLARLERDRERPVRIGAAVDRDLGIERLEAAARVGIGGEAVVMLARIGARHEVLAPVLDIAERPAEFEREPGDAQFFRLQHAFVAEAAAHVGRDHAHLPLFDAEKLRKAGANDVRHLGRGVDHELVAAVVPVGQHRLAFHRHHGLARERDLARDHDRRVLALGRKAAVVVEREEAVVVPFLVDPHAASARAACASTSTGSSSTSSSIASQRSSACARVGATHMATASPTKRTLPCASGGHREIL